MGELPGSSALVMRCRAPKERPELLVDGLPLSDALPETLFIPLNVPPSGKVSRHPQKWASGRKPGQAV
jgi:hypothetical protein